MGGTGVRMHITLHVNVNFLFMLLGLTVHLSKYFHPEFSAGQQLQFLNAINQDESHYNVQNEFKCVLHTFICANTQQIGLN